MGEKIAFENGRISEFQGHVTLTLTLTLDRAILHTVMHHSSTSIYIPNVIEIEDTFCGRTGGRNLRPTLLGRLGTRRSRPKMAKIYADSVACYLMIRHGKYADATDGQTDNQTLYYRPLH